MLAGVRELYHGKVKPALEALLRLLGCDRSAYAPALIARQARALRALLTGRRGLFAFWGRAAGRQAERRRARALYRERIAADLGALVGLRQHDPSDFLAEAANLAQRRHRLGRRVPELFRLALGPAL
jgi:hypothetical protein